MAKRIVMAIRPLRRVKGAYEGAIEYMPGYTKTFVGKNVSWILAEMEKALDNKIPTLSGPMEVAEDE